MWLLWNILSLRLASMFLHQFWCHLQTKINHKHKHNINQLFYNLPRNFLYWAPNTSRRFKFDPQGLEWKTHKYWRSEGNCIFDSSSDNFLWCILWLIFMRHIKLCILFRFHFKQASSTKKKISFWDTQF